MSSWKESMINRLSNLINRNRSAAKISQVLCFNRYGVFWVPPGESLCPDGSEYVWQRGVESFQGQVTDGQS